MKRVLIYCGSLFLLMCSILLLWKARQAHYGPKISEAKLFCEVLIPEVEAAKWRDGKYPKVVDPRWLEGKRIPQLIRPNDFYDSHGDVYRFHFRYPGNIWDNVWAYQCGPQQACDWGSYDEN
jgi:hypothetical protein